MDHLLRYSEIPHRYGSIWGGGARGRFSGKGAGKIPEYHNTQNVNKYQQVWSIEYNNQVAKIKWWEIADTIGHADAPPSLE